MHTFHLPCGECTITLEDVHLQLGLPVDGDAVTGSVHSADWGAVCYELLGTISDNIKGSRIEMGWLRDTFPEPDDDSTELEKIRYARAYILQVIGGYLMSDLSRNLVHLRWLLKLVDFRVAGEFSWGSTVLATLYREMCGATRLNKAKIGDIRLLLEQQSEAQVPLVNFAIVEMHQSDRVLRQFGFRQLIPVAPEVLDDHHKIDLRQLHTD
ncbi:protein MAINTENANCE OF MERISTEMS-like [Gossypium arboreum]|uniref:protein MAINTENANCE OF MERISTEMS-like n=1 Tax=Gossypium arboreum TaxID=29729 RepID=UPI0022F1BE67|nr:protein MAINTENANCE OF MERISTEMS-like [Gossypium arboreum]